MEQDRETVRIPIQRTHGCLVASIQVDLDDVLLRQFQHDLLTRIEAARCVGVILELSGVEVMDAHDFESLRRCAEMARIMGARTIMVGLQAGVVAALVDLDANVDGVEATLDLEEAFHLLTEPARAAEAEAPGVERWTSADRGAHDQFRE